jgi:hypothetical protein
VDVLRQSPVYCNQVLEVIYIILDALNKCQALNGSRRRLLCGISAFRLRSTVDWYVLKTQSLIGNNFATFLSSANCSPNHQNTARPRVVDLRIDILIDYSYMHNSTLF